MKAIDYRIEATGVINQHSNFVTNYVKGLRTLYEEVIAEFETVYPQYKGDLITKDGAFDIHDNPLHHMNSVWRTRTGVNMTAFWEIFALRELQIKYVRERESMLQWIVIAQALKHPRAKHDPKFKAAAEEADAWYQEKHGESALERYNG